MNGIVVFKMSYFHVSSIAYTKHKFYRTHAHIFYYYYTFLRGYIFSCQTKTRCGNIDNYTYTLFTQHTWLKVYRFSTYYQPPVHGGVKSPPPPLPSQHTEAGPAFITLNDDRILQHPEMFKVKTKSHLTTSHWKDESKMKISNKKTMQHLDLLFRSKEYFD